MESNNLKMEYPPVTSYPIVANMFSILWANKEFTIPWIADHFIQLRVSKEPLDFYISGNFFDYMIYHNVPIYMICPFIKVQVVDDSILHIYNRLTDFVEYSINNNNYVSIALNNFYFPCSPHYGKNHYMHPTFINGYDKNKKQIFVSDFYTNQRYIRNIVSYAQLNDSFEYKVVEKDFIGEPMFEYCNLLRYNQFNYATDLNLIKRSLSDYLNSKNSFDRSNYDYKNKDVEFYYGLEYYERILEYYLHSQSCEGSDSIPLDFRFIFILCDHKKLMSIRLEHLYKMRTINSKDFLQLSAKCVELLKQTTKILMLSIKYTATRNASIFTSILRFLEALKKFDAEVCTEILNVLQRKN